jgi:uncharacterized protein (DUF433 family)/predicted nuclease of predicted toxin-antitoxin system
VRIPVNPDVRFGKPCIRGHRITVQEILEGLSSGASQEQILADYPQLEPDDFLAVYADAAELAGDQSLQRMKLLFDEILSPRLVPLLSDLFPGSESAPRNGLARIGDRRILEYAAEQDFVLVSTDSDFERPLKEFTGAKVAILRLLRLSNRDRGRGASA